MNINLTLIGQTITFVVFVWFCYKFIWPYLITAMRERQQAIAAGLEAGERAGRDLERAKERATKELAEARGEAQRIIDQARGQAGQMLEQARQDAKAEGERIKEAAAQEVEQEVNRAREALRGEVAELAVAGAERILRASIDRRRHETLLTQLAAEL